MPVSIQKANLGKRIMAFIFDMILTVILAFGLATAMSAIVGYDKYEAQIQSYYDEYEDKYGIKIEGLTSEEYKKLSDEDKAKYEAAEDAWSKDQRVLKNYNMRFSLSLLIISIPLLLSYANTYFVVPLLFKNGQTLGKKIFGLAVIRTNCIKASNPVLFVRSILGFYTMETMVPVLMIVMIFFGMLGIVGIITIALLLLLEIIVIIATKTNSSIHDLLSDTVVVDYSSQQIFESQEALDEYNRKLAEEKAAEDAADAPTGYFLGAFHKNN